MTAQWWNEPECRERHRVTRGSMHGYYQLVCVKIGYHEAMPMRAARAAENVVINAFRVKKELTLNLP